MNFHPRIEDADEKQLYDWIQNAQPGHGSLASDELTRRKLDKLNKTIEISEHQNEKLETSNYRLQIAMLVLTAVTTTVALFPAFKWLLGTLAVLITKVDPTPILKIEDIGVLSSVLSAAAGILTAVIASMFTLKFEKENKLRKQSLKEKK